MYWDLWLGRKDIRYRLTLTFIMLDQNFDKRLVNYSAILTRTKRRNIYDDQVKK